MAEHRDGIWFGVGKAGGIAFEKDLDKAAGNKEGVRPPRGIFAEVPASTPKYALNEGEVSNDFREQMARLFIQIPDYSKFVASFSNDPSTQQIAKVIGGTVATDGATNPGEGNGYVDFLLQNVQHNLQEKVQIVETIADDHVSYFFGQAAPTFAYSGTALNTKQDNQAHNLLRIYRDLGRGTMLAQRNTLISIRYDGMIASGTMLNLSLGLTAEMETAVPFAFNLLVKKITLLPAIYDGLVLLAEPFAKSKEGYAPFETGPSIADTRSLKFMMAPAATIVPAASTSEEKDNAAELAEINSGFDALKQLTQSTAPTGTSATTKRLTDEYTIRIWDAKSKTWLVSKGAAK